MVIRRNDNETDSDFVARLGESMANALPAEGFVCSVLSTVFPPENKPTELSVLARAKVGRPIATVRAVADDINRWFVVWKIDPSAPDRGNFTTPRSIICSVTALGAFEDHNRMVEHKREHGWSPNHI